MELSTKAIERYREDGYLLVENVFTKQETEMMLNEMSGVLREDCPRRILEKNGSVRSFFAPDHSNDLFYRTTRSGKIVLPAIQLLEGEVYIHQTKLNTKHAMVGDWWEWHQDYTFWKQDDGMPEPKVLTAMIYLNDVNEFNGPMLLIPGSHKGGVVDKQANDIDSGAGSSWFSNYQRSTSYMSALTADLKYTLKKDTIAGWIGVNGICSAKAPAGSVLFFDGNVFHASANNLSPWDRHSFLVTYNSVSNALANIEKPRPAFLANRDFTPVIPMEGELLEYSENITNHT